MNFSLYSSSVIKSDKPILYLIKSSLYRISLPTSSDGKLDKIVIFLVLLAIADKSTANLFLLSIGKTTPIWSEFNLFLISFAIWSNVAKLPSLIPTTASVTAITSLSLKSNFSLLLAFNTESTTIDARSSPSFIIGVLIPLTIVPTFLIKPLSYYILPFLIINKNHILHMVYTYI